MKQLLCISIAAFNCCNAFSQSLDNNWAFGDSSGLNFFTDPPTYFKSSINSHEACASISDSSGNLLFYTNGQNIWNKNNEVMPNGDSIDIGLLVGSDPSSITQGVIIVPKPESNHLYYTFQIQGASEPSYNLGIEYCVVDMNLEVGLGNVSEKNVDLYTENICEKMQAVKHANGRDWWLLVRTSGYPDSTFSFIRFLITPFGIEGPYFQSLYFPSDGTSIKRGESGQMKFSLDGSKLATTRSTYFDIYDFDRCTGEVSNVQTIKVEAEIFIYGCEFSADARKIYLSQSMVATNKNIVYQYCLNCIEPIEETKEIIFENTFEDYGFGQLQIGPNGKIYTPIVSVTYDNHIYSDVNGSICVINNPGVDGLACDFDTLTIPLSSGSRCTLALPNMPNYNLGALPGSPCDTIGDTTDVINIIINTQDFAIYPNPANTFITITSHLNNYTSTIAEIYNAAGIKVKEEKIISTTQKINTEILVAGVYSIVVKQEEKYLYQDKLIIAR